MKRPKLLCVDNDASTRQKYERVLGGRGYDVVLAGGGPQALNLFHSKDNDVAAVISGYDMPGMNGAELAAELKHCNPRLPVIMVSASQPALEEAPHFVDAAVPKGAPVERIVSKVETLLAARAEEEGVPLSRYVPMGAAIAGLALAGFLLPRIWE